MATPGSAARGHGRELHLGLAAGVAVNAVRRPLRFGPSPAAIVLAFTLASTPDDRELHRERRFFGVPIA